MKPLGDQYQCALERISDVEDPNKSYRKRGQALLMKPLSMLTILQNDFKLTTNKMNNVQQLSLTDKAARMKCAHVFKKRWTMMTHG